MCHFSDLQDVKSLSSRLGTLKDKLPEENPKIAEVQYKIGRRCVWLEVAVKYFVDEIKCLSLILETLKADASACSTYVG